ncbi:MAG: hypothetical protein VYD19_02450 [Myxococcota bacterium]|nr:hypothetical protein [Myxococcota bacterium]
MRLNKIENARRLFYLAAFWNLSAAVVALAVPSLHADSFYGDASVLNGADAAIASLNSQLFWVAVLFFALGYWLVARDPSQNHALVLVAALGKAAVGLRWLWAYQGGLVTSFALVGAVGDLVFAGLFMLFLAQHRATSATP